MNEQISVGQNLDDQIIVERRGELGILTLNRPRQLNAISLNMVRLVRQQLEAWRTDDGVTRILIRGAGERGFSAGGDIVELHRSVASADTSEAATFLFDEYQLYAAINEYPKPIVTLQDGLTLGGGVGMSGHASHRIVTERSRLGFPEVAIGFVPDVGGTWLLSRARTGLGMRIALSAEQVGPAEAIEMGMSDVHVPSERLDELVAALESGEVDAVLKSFATAPEPGPLAADAERLDEAFEAESVGEILDRLRESDPELAERIASQSPEALVVTHVALVFARGLASLREALQAEYLVSTSRFDRPDFVEGIRALMIDKDRSPKWSPASFDEVKPEIVAAHFAEGRHGSLNFHSPRATTF